VLARSSPKIAIAAPYGLGGVPEGTASSIFRSPCESVRACMTAARVEASTGPQIRNRAPVVNATSITPGDIGNAGYRRQRRGGGCRLRYFLLLSHVRNHDIGRVAP